MARWCHLKCRLRKLMGWLQMLLGGLVIIFSICSLFKFYSAGFFFHNEDICRQFTGIKDAYEGFDIKALSDRVGQVLSKLESLQEKLEAAVQRMEKDKEALLTTNITKFEFKKYLEEEVIRPLYTAHISLRLIRLPKAEGTFAARMREHNVTVVSTALNLRVPFNEMIALRGLVPLFITLNQRLLFFDNTMDMVHTAGFLDGWIDLQLLDFILFDWDRILRPGGLLWIDRFFCVRKDLDDFMSMFLQLRYKKHKWAISPKSKDEVYFSALLEKPPRAI